jgi:hypothetical protein
VRRFRWNGCIVQVVREPPVAPLLGAWFARWMDPKDQKPQAGMWSEVVHSVTEPKQEDDVWSFSVDLGTAPPRAVLELLEALCVEGTAGVLLDQ